jgi:hypothetical protein
MDTIAANVCGEALAPRWSRDRKAPAPTRGFELLFAWSRANAVLV